MATGWKPDGRRTRRPARPGDIARGGNNTWAPDVIRSGDKYFVYYSAPGTQPKAAIGLLVGKTLDPASPDYKWEDAGPVVWSDGVEDSNAIDPGVLRDPTTGRLWLTYGSYFGYIRLVELNPKTGLRLHPTRAPINVAINSEASIMIYRDGMPPLKAMSILVVAVVAAALSLVARAQDPTPRPPAPTLTRATSAAKPADARGFLRRWLVLEPIATKGPLIESFVQGAAKREPFLSQLTSVPSDGATVTVGGETLAWHALDTKAYNLNLYHFAWALSKPTSNVLFWAVTVVDAPREMKDVRLAIGSNAASIWWVNGEEVIAIYNDRQTVIDDGVSKRLTLLTGRNVVRAAIVNGGGATDFCARFLDGEDRPITNLRVDLGLR